MEQSKVGRKEVEKRRKGDGSEGSICICYKHCSIAITTPDNAGHMMTENDLHNCSSGSK